LVSSKLFFNSNLKKGKYTGMSIDLNGLLYIAASSPILDPVNENKLIGTVGSA
jgi:hypothetical protein